MFEHDLRTYSGLFFNKGFGPLTLSIQD